MRGAKVCAVIVTYCFSAQSLPGTLNSISSQVERVVLVDNGSPNASALQELTATLPQLHIIFLSRNEGVAAAQNIGVQHAIEAGFEYMVLFDQDSLPSEGMIDHLVEAHSSLQKAGEKVAAVGPRLFDPRLQRYLPFYSFAKGRYSPIAVGAAEQFVRTPILISSGLLFHRDTIRQVGLMDAALFIDHVDHEWGFRAQAKQYSLHGVLTATMAHEIGGEIVSIAGIEFQRHAPIRYYYMFRNSLLLYKRSYVPWAWKRADVTDRLSLLRICLFQLRPRRENLRMICRGLWDGLWGATGSIRGSNEDSKK